MGTDKLRKLIEELGEPFPEPRIIPDSLKPVPEPSVIQALFKPRPPLEEMRSAFVYLEEHYQDALDNARKCNIMDALRDMASAHDSGASLTHAAHNARQKRNITLDEYGDVLEAIEEFELYGLPDAVAKALMDNCECRK